jgi:4-oxalocrotonate tautomerase
MPTNSHILKPDILRRTYNLSIPLTVMPVIQITISQGRSIQQKRELVKVLTRETARIMKTEEEKVRILIYEVSKENWGNAGILGLDMK